MKNQKRNLIKTISIIAFIGILFAQSNILAIKTQEIHSNSLLIPTVAANQYPILINGNDELATFIENEGLSGDGTEISPYIIENFIIDSSAANGIEINNTDAYLTIRGCTISEDADDYLDNAGILLNNTANVNITNNILSNNDIGIFMYSSNNNTLFLNNINDNNAGITLGRSSNNTIFGNDMNYHKYVGIQIWSGNNNTVFGNNISYTVQSGANPPQPSFQIFQQGIQIWNSNNSILIGNNISYNCIGIYLYESNYCVFFGNSIRNNYDKGFCLIRSNNSAICYNEIYREQNLKDHQDFENDHGEASENEGCVDNKWDNGTVGNYWGNYTIKHPDAKNNGIVWDTPYEIDGKGAGIDNFPLVNPIFDIPIDKTIKIPGFPIIYILIFVSVGVFLLRKEVSK